MFGLDKKVAIVLPNFNSFQFIAETINSIINQTYKNWNLIIVDDGSDIKTKEILKKYNNNKKIKIIFLKKNCGAGYCRNLALKLSKSYYVAFIDSDDTWDKNKLKKQINFMKKNKISFSYTNYTAIFQNKIKKIKLKKRFNFETFINNTSIATSTMIVERTKIKNIRFPNTKICEDYFFKCRLLKKIEYAYCFNQYLTKYRIRKNSLQSNKFANIYWIWKINKFYNKFNFFKNLRSIFFISLNSLKKYGLK
jgi:teichuronic acid biosynthesis glycosyltransferase TuaG